MKNINTLVIFGLFLTLITCKSPVNIISPQKSDLEEYTMMTGEGATKIWIDKSIIVGIVHDNYTNMDSVSMELKALHLEWDTNPTIRTDINLPRPTSHYTCIKRTDGDPISQNESHEFEKLRVRYWNDFGPGIYLESGIITGVLSNSITVYFERRTSQERINEILTSSQATKFTQVRQYDYHVEFPKSWGYEVLDVAKQIFNLEEVRAVENQVQVIISPT